MSKISRDEFVTKLGELLNLAGCGVDRLEYDDDRELVTIVYDNGYTRTANVAADSHIAVIVDVLKVVYR